MLGHGTHHEVPHDPVGPRVDLVDVVTARVRHVDERGVVPGDRSDHGVGGVHIAGVEQRRHVVVDAERRSVRQRPRSAVVQRCERRLSYRPRVMLRRPAPGNSERNHGQDDAGEAEAHHRRDPAPRVAKNRQISQAAQNVDGGPGSGGVAPGH